MSWFSKAFSGFGNALNPVSAVKNITKDVTSKPSFGKFWDSFGNADPLTHGIINAQSSLDDTVTGKALSGVGLNKLGSYFQKSGQDPTQASLHHVLAGLAYLGGSAALAGGAGDAAGAAADAGTLGGEGTAMGDAAGTLGAADSAAASADMGLTAADLGGGGAAISPGGAADLLMGGGGDVASTTGEQVGNFLASGGDYGAAPTTSSGFGGVGTDASVMSSPDNGLAMYQQAGEGAATPGASASTSGLQDALKTALKYGPAGLSLMRGLMGKGAYSKAASDYSNVGAAQRATANGLVSAYNKGTLNPAESAGIDRWAQQQVAALRQFYANAGTSDSTQAIQAEAAVMQKAAEMKNQATQDLLKVGLNELNTLDQNTVRGIQTNLQGDIAAQQAQANFASTFAKLIGSTQTPTPATTTTGP